MKEDPRADWIPRLEAAALIGLSVRTLDRMISEGKIETDRRRIPGRKPVVVCNPTDVQREVEKTAQPVWVESQEVAVAGAQKPSDASPAVRRPMLPITQMALPGVAELLSSMRPPDPPPFWLSVKQAAARSGLTDGYLRAAIRAGRLPAITQGVKAWKIRLTALEAFEG